MTRILAGAVLTVAIACAAYVAHSQDMTPQEPVGAAIGSIVVENRPTRAVVTSRTFQVGPAEVVVHYESTANGVLGVDPRDIVTVTVSEGYIAVPSDVLLPEGESVEIVIYEALLG